MAVGRLLALRAGRGPRPMLECLRQRSAEIARFGLKTWGDLLSHLEPELRRNAPQRDGGSVRRCRPAVIPWRRSRGPPLATLGRIEVETRRRQPLAQKHARHRRRQPAAPGRGRLPRRHQRFAAPTSPTPIANLPASSKCVRTLTLLTIASARGFGVDPREPRRAASRTGADVLGGVAHRARRARAVAGRPRLGAVADALENDLAPALLHWGVVFDAMHDRCAA